MRPITVVDIKQNRSCCGTADEKVAQCCSKSSKLVAGCHD